MSLLKQLCEGLSAAGFSVSLEEDHVVLLGENGENVGVCEIVGGWAHTQIFFGDDFESPALMSSLLRANDRVLGFRFCLDASGYASARCEALVDETIQPHVIRMIESMLEAVPAYWRLFDRCRAEDRPITEAELDMAAENFDRTLN